MRKRIVITGLTLILVAFAVLMILDPGLNMILFGATQPTRQFQGGQGNFPQVGGGQFQGGQGNFSQVGRGQFQGGMTSMFQSTMSTTYYRFTAYLGGFAGIVVTSIGILLGSKKEDSPTKDSKGSGKGGGDTTSGDWNASLSAEAASTPTGMAGESKAGPHTHSGKSKRDIVMHLNSVVKIYPGNGVATPALQGVSLEISRSEFVAIVGPSGGGKSTLLNIIGCLDRPTSGKYLLDGVDVSKLNDKELAVLRNRKIGFVFQSFNLISRMTALDNVEFPLATRNIRTKRREQMAWNALQLVGLNGKALRVPSRLSGGEQQRVAVARALVTEPAILLGDEPTGNLDTKNTKSLIDLLHHLNKTTGRTIVMITHNMEIANEADRIIYLRDGRVERDEYTHSGIDP